MINPLTVENLVKLKDLPENIVISTITVTFTLNNIINTQNIAKYSDISEHGFTKVIFGIPPDDLTGFVNSDKCIIRSYYPIIKKRKRLVNKHNNNTNSGINETNNNIEQQVMKSNNKRKNSENNQCRIKIWSSVTKDCVSVSIFNNGSVHITGIKSFKMFEEIYEKILNEITKRKHVCDLDTNVLTFKPFLETDIAETLFTEVNNFQICMINCTFDVHFNIKLKELDKIMRKIGAPTKLDVSKHACVNTKFNYENLHEVSIFIFESGKINITGSRSYDEIICAYEYIVCILYENIRSVILVSIDSLDPEVIKNYNKTSVQI